MGQTRAIRARAVSPWSFRPHQAQTRRFRLWVRVEHERERKLCARFHCYPRLDAVVVAVCEGADPARWRATLPVRTSSVGFSEERAGGVGFGFGVHDLIEDRWERSGECEQAGERENQYCGDCIGHGV